jgi:glyceraldehyde 3-phosphate dehydrogenase
MAIRAPVITGSVVDLTVTASRETSVDEVNAALEAAARQRPLQGILEYADAPLVSTDIVRNPHSSIFDSQLTSVMEGTMVKVISWYDNEWGYSNRVADVAQRLL